ncbi:cohesin domain-containing protein [Methylococcus sp. EFPC2]|uniref:cohesin domain-containing protein n=1 Tax=Methylococcus sp. EFPC2 TaxID=2812648 RepID=UPI0019685185|nr:cohesin domain-containing protein [Methylococcus sp. EFPC2]QSA98387.1 hypothetical protein JWZ97_06155 [Methylococcus sp. EFPC2]
MRSIHGLLVAVVLAIAPFAAHSVPLSIPDQSGFQGQQVTLNLLDDLTNNLEAATVVVTYDPSRLDFVDALVGTLTGDFSVIPGIPSVGQVVVSLATFTLPVDQQTGSILALNFLIKPTAPLGITEVTVECERYPDTSCKDYEVPATTGKITVLAATNNVPETATLPLELLGLGVLAWRRRAGTGKAA